MIECVEFGATPSKFQEKLARDVQKLATNHPCGLWERQKILEKTRGSPCAFADPDHIISMGLMHGANPLRRQANERETLE